MENFKDKLFGNHNQNDYKKNDISDIDLNFKRNLKVKNLSFAYGKKNVFKDLNFEINKGAIVGFKGLSGVGKSTLFYILLGLLNEYSGEIIIDEKKVDLNNQNWRNQIGYLSSNTYLLDETIKQNIIFSDDIKVDEQHLLNSIKFSELEDYINNTSNGINTYLGDDGAKISSGQKQRLGLARLFYSNKNILFFDEATNSLDKHTEKKIFENLRLLNKNSTKFIISHDNTNLDLCDKIIDIK